MKIVKLLYLVLVCSVLTACWDRDTDADIKKEKITIKRFDRTVDEFVKTESQSSKKKMLMDYQRPTQILIEEILGLGDVDEEAIMLKLQSYYKDETLLRLSDDINKKFKDLSKIEKQLTSAFCKLRKELPEIKQPYIYAQNSALNESIIVEDTLIGISLDKYMGQDYPLYKKYYYDYQIETMTQERIIVDCISYYLIGQIEYPSHKDLKLINLMIHYGKVLYIADYILGNNCIGCTIGYTKDNIDWCEKNEKELLRYIKQKDEFHATDNETLRKYMRPIPKTAFNGEAPQMIGLWIGARIVKNYMEKNKNITIKDLIEDKNYEDIFIKSGYCDRSIDSNNSYSTSK